MNDVELTPVEPFRGDHITPIVLKDADGGMAVFHPQADMTGIEAVLVAQLFAKVIIMGTVNPVVPADWRSYLKDYRLERHFEAVLPAPAQEG